MGRAAARVVVVAAVVAAASACGDGGSATQAFGARTATSINLKAQITVGGTVSVSASWVDSISPAASARTCAGAAQGFVQDGLRYDMPHPPSTTPLGGHVLAVGATVRGYHGPGTYTSITGATGTSTILDIDGQGWAVAGGGTAHVDVHADDSGLLVFEKLTPAAAAPASPGAAVPPGPQKAGTLTGTLAWSCSDLEPNGAGGTATQSQVVPAPSPTP